MWICFPLFIIVDYCLFKIRFSRLIEYVQRLNYRVKFNNYKHPQRSAEKPGVTLLR